MKLRMFALVLSGLTFGFSGAMTHAADLNLAKDVSKIEFVGSKPDGKHKGGFKKFEVAAVADFDSPDRSSLNIQIDAGSLWSDDEKLTNHLKSPDFFDVRKYPSITFESTEIVPGQGDDAEPHAMIKGNMVMLGKSVEMEVPIKANVTDEAVELTAEFEIDRTKWGMDYGQGKIDNTVKISVELTMKR